MVLFYRARMSDNSHLIAAARGDLDACHPKNRAEECVFEAISDAINASAPGCDALDKLIEVLPHAKIWVALRSTMRCLGIQVLSAHGKAVATCIINAFHSGEDLNEWAEDALVRYMLCKSAAIGTNLPVEAPDNSSASQSSPVQNTRKQSSKAKQAQSISKRFKEDEGYSSDVSDPTTPAKTRERYLTAIEELEIDRIDHTTFLHHILKGASIDFFFSDISGRDPRPRLGEAFELLERRFETHEKQLQFR
jgi:hypothetical protein